MIFPSARVTEIKLPFANSFMRKKTPAFPPILTCATMTVGPTSPGIEEPRYQPETSAVAGTSIVPSAFRPREMIPLLTPMAGIDIEVGTDCFKQLAKVLVVTAAEDTSFLPVATKPTGTGQARGVRTGVDGDGNGDSDGSEIGVLVTEGSDDGIADGDAEGVGDFIELDGDGEGVSVGLKVGMGVGLKDGVAVGVALKVDVGMGVALKVGVAVGVALKVGVAVGDGVVQVVTEVVFTGDPAPPVVVVVVVQLGVGVGEGVAVTVGVGEGVGEGDAQVGV
jgi:hypothetical protein